MGAIVEDAADEAEERRAGGVIRSLGSRWRRHPIFVFFIFASLRARPAARPPAKDHGVSFFVLELVGYGVSVREGAPAARPLGAPGRPPRSAGVVGTLAEL